MCPAARCGSGYKSLFYIARGQRERHEDQPHRGSLLCGWMEFVWPDQKETVRDRRGAIRFCKTKYVKTKMS